MTLAELKYRGITPLFRIDVGEERVKKVLARGFINEKGTILAITERKRRVVVFPEMLGSFHFPIVSAKEKKFIDYSPRR